MCVYLQETVDEWMSDLMRKMTVESLVRKPEEGEVEMIEWQQTSSSRSRDRSQEDPRQHTRGSQSTSTGFWIANKDLGSISYSPVQRKNSKRENYYEQ